MKTIFACSKYEVLSLDGLRYETSFTHIHNSLQSTHLPLFGESDNLFVQVGRSVRRFVPKQSIYGFRYYNNEGQLSDPWSAIVCELEGESSDCVILGRYSQSRDCELDDYEYGRFSFWKIFPEIFYADRARDRRIIPGLNRVFPNAESSEYVIPDRPVLAYTYSPELGKIVRIPVEVQFCAIDAKGQRTIRCQAVDEGTAFWDSAACSRWCFDNFIVL